MINISELRDVRDPYNLPNSLEKPAFSQIFNPVVELLVVIIRMFCRIGRVTQLLLVAFKREHVAE